MSDTIYESQAQSRAQPRTTRPGPGAAPVRAATPRQAEAPTTGERLHRRRRSSNPFDIPKHLIPAHLSYEWKAESIYGQPQTDHQIELRENHWTAVPAERHPELAMAGATTIRRGDGTILMERPKYLTEEAQMEDINEALARVGNVDNMVYGTPPGTLTRNHPSVQKASYINRQYAPGEPIVGGGDQTESEP